MFEARTSSDTVAGPWRPLDESGLPHRPVLPALADLGPVLLVQRAPGAPGPLWILRLRVDSAGVSEFLDAGTAQVHRLPDSDFLGWERVATTCRRREALAVCVPRREASAFVVRARSGAWEPVRSLSALGWDVVQRLLRREHARLVQGGAPRFD